MATRQEMMAALRAADSAGDETGAQRIAGMIRQFDVDASRATGIGAPFQAADDMARIFTDSASRGFLDKGLDTSGLGGGEQEKTQAARERAGWAQYPADIAGAVVSTPVRGIGAAWGALEGAANEYGHQKNWVPSLSDAGDIALGAGKGAALGYAGGRVGDYVGKKIAQREALAAQPYKTDKDFLAASERAQGELSDTATKLDYGKRAERLNAARSAQGGTRDEFATMMAGMEKPAAEQAAVDKIAAPRLRTAASNAVEEVAPKKFSLPALAMETMVGHGIPWWTLGGLAAKKGLTAVGNAADKVKPKEVDDLAALIRDPSGRGLTLDPAISARWRDAFAKAAIGAGR